MPKGGLVMAEHELDLNDPRTEYHEGRTWMEFGQFDDLDPVEGETDHEAHIRERRPTEGMVQVAVCSCGEELRGRNQRQIKVKFEEHSKVVA
jgi:hypothetical protein